MNVLLTGASGFVGSRILDRLRTEGIPTSILLRQSSRTRLIADHLPHVNVHYGSLANLEAVRAAMQGATHVIHCAGCTKTLHTVEFYEANERGTRQVVTAVNEPPGRIRRLVQISSLAAAGPALPDRPASEEDPPRPVSEYGKSKLAGEREVKAHCRAEWVILRPGAVYGPGDADFLALFKALRAHVFPNFGGGRQTISLVFVDDLATAAVTALTHPMATGKTYHVASHEAVQVRDFAREIAGQMKVSTFPLTLPRALLLPVCLVRGTLSRLTGTPHILSLDKYRELAAPGWVCDTRKIRRELAWAPAGSLADGIAATLAWYRRNGWLT